MMTRTMRRIVDSLVASSWRSPLSRPGAKVFGRITVGHYLKIDVNAVIYPDIPNMAVAAMKPGFEILSMNGNQP